MRKLFGYLIKEHKEPNSSNLPYPFHFNHKTPFPFPLKPNTPYSFHATYTTQNERQVHPHVSGQAVQESAAICYNQKMKIILFYAPSFWFRTYEKVLEEVPDQDVEKTTENAVVVFYQAEAGDVDREGSILTKFVKNIKWLAGKFKTKNVVLHSFGHLSLSKAPADFTNKLMGEAKDRLNRAGFTVIETPFGYLNEWKIHVAGDSLAKVFKKEKIDKEL